MMNVMISGFFHILMWNFSKNCTFFKLENVKFFGECDFFWSSHSWNSEIAPRTCKKSNRSAKIAKISACGGSKGKEEQENIDWKFDLEKNSHTPKSIKKHCFGGSLSIFSSSNARRSSWKHPKMDLRNLEETIRLTFRVTPAERPSYQVSGEIARSIAWTVVASGF